MAQLKIGDSVNSNGHHGVVKAILNDGIVRAEFGGQEFDIPVSSLTGGVVQGAWQATGFVMGLLPDPPAAMARMAEKTGYPILPSPMAPETNKSGIVPDGLVKYLGADGFLHVVPGASSFDDQVDLETVIVRED